MNDDHVPVRPVRTPAPWVGGKRLLAQRLDARIRAVPHRAYVEVFLGMGGVFLRRTARPPVEVVNDLSSDVVTLFRVLQRHHQALMDMLKWQLTSRAEFERLVAARADTLTDLERAARLLYVQRLAYSGKVEGRNFAAHATMPARFDTTKLTAVLEAVHERLSRVVIERLSYGPLIARYDRAETLFYLDPPYWGCEDYYGREMFSRADFERLAEQLAGVRGQWLMSLNDVPGVREVFGAFAIERVETTYSLSGTRTAAGELIISGGGGSG